MEENYDYMKPKRKLGDLDGTVQDIYSPEDGVRRKRRSQKPSEGGGIIDLLMKKRRMKSWHDQV